MFNDIGPIGAEHLAVALQVFVESSAQPENFSIFFLFLLLRKTRA
jgi:hypothetical protein